MYKEYILKVCLHSNFEVCFELYTGQFPLLDRAKITVDSIHTKLKQAPMAIQVEYRLTFATVVVP